MATITLTAGTVYDTDSLTFAGWRLADGSTTDCIDGLSCWDFFRDGKYLEADQDGVEPMFAEQLGQASFHKSNLGKFGEHLPCDMNGYVHLTAEAWRNAPIDMPAADRSDDEYMAEWSEEQAAATQSLARTNELIGR